MRTNLSTKLTTNPMATILPVPGSCRYLLYVITGDKNNSNNHDGIAAMASGFQKISAIASYECKR